ncbi:MAG: hypothetical protein HY740_09490 [Chloroflexi bacterium]|nr:hypothetical protein [Chloroflexota bacterium]
MLAESLVIPKPAYNLLRRLTGESRPDVALSLALKDLVHLRLEAARSKDLAFEKKYNMSFTAFEKAWKDGNVAEPYSYTVEKDYLEWEAATTDTTALTEMSQWLI